MSFGVQSASLFSGSSSSSDTSASTSLRPFANLDLTEDQRTQIRAIFKNAKADGLSSTEVQTQINAILTPAQLTTFEADIENAAASSSTADSSSSSSSTSSTQAPQGPPPSGGNPFTDPNGPFANLDLTSDQQTQIAQIFSDAKSQGLTFDQINDKINAILTSSQQATFATDLQNLPSPPGAPDSSDASTASATVSGQSQSGSDDSSASAGSSSGTTGVTEDGVQKQIAAAAALILQQLQYELATSTS